MECMLCFENYNETSNKPYNLYKCGHTYCIKCINKLREQKCPMCNESIESKYPCYAIIQMIKETSSKNQLTSLSTQTGTSQVVSLSFEFCEKRLLKILKKKSANSSIILNKIESEFGHLNAQHMFVFIRALATAVSRSCLNKSTGLDEIKFTNLCSLLSMFINSNQEFEMEAVFALKTLQNKKQYQHAFIERLLNILKWKNVLSENSIALLIIDKWQTEMALKKQIPTKNEFSVELISFYAGRQEFQNISRQKIGFYNKQSLLCESMPQMSLKTDSVEEKKKIKKKKQLIKIEPQVKIPNKVSSFMIDPLVQAAQEPLAFKNLISCIGSSIQVFDINTRECIKVFMGHTDSVNSAKVLNNDTIVSCSEDKTIKLWDMTTGECLKTLLGHSDYVLCVEKLTSHLIASCSGDKTIRIWNVESGGCLKVMEGHSDEVVSIKFLSVDHLISGSWDKTIKLWNFNTGQCLKTFGGHELDVEWLEVLSNNRIVSVSADKTIKIWDINTGECLKTLYGHTNSIRCVSILPDEKIITGTRDGEIKVWCLKTYNCIKTMNGHTNWVTGIHVLSNDKVASSSSDETIKFWDLVSGNCFETILTGSPVSEIQACNLFFQYKEKFLMRS